jgi:hypothetical protein
MRLTTTSNCYRQILFQTRRLVCDGGGGGMGEEVRKVYAAVLLAKFLILKGWARRPSILPVGHPYVGCILVALVFGRVAKGAQE